MDTKLYKMEINGKVNIFVYFKIIFCKNYTFVIHTSFDILIL